MTQVLQQLRFALEAFTRSLVLGAEPHPLDCDGLALGGVVCLGNDCLPTRSDGLRQGVAAQELRWLYGFGDHENEDKLLRSA